MSAGYELASQSATQDRTALARTLAFVAKSLAMNASKGPRTSVAAMTTSLEAVLARVAKELERSMSPHNHPGTAYVGGITKLGANLDAFLLDVWSWSCAHLGLDPRATALRQPQPILLDRATAGQLLHLLSTLAKLPVAAQPEVEWVIAEARDGSALHRALELRNAIVHGREMPDVATIRTSLERVQRALAPQLERLRQLA